MADEEALPFNPHDFIARAKAIFDERNGNITARHMVRILNSEGYHPCPPREMRVYFHQWYQAMEVKPGSKADRTKQRLAAEAADLTTATRIMNNVAQFKNINRYIDDLDIEGIDHLFQNLTETSEALTERVLANIHTLPVNDIKDARALIELAEITRNAAVEVRNYSLNIRAHAARQAEDTGDGAKIINGEILPPENKAGAPEPDEDDVDLDFELSAAARKVNAASNTVQ